MVKRSGRPHLALPEGGEAALRTLALYQPQRAAGRLLAASLRASARIGLHGVLARAADLPGGAPEPLEPPVPDIVPDSCGIMLGSPEHSIRRAIASYQTAQGWEVAKIAIGSEGAKMLAREAATLVEFSAISSSVPPCLGIHHGNDITLLRMRSIDGRPLAVGTSHQALALLDDWVSNYSPRPARDFSEWNDIARALDHLPETAAIFDRLSETHLTPVLRHGDFARWNLLAQPDGRLIALDWEWGGSDGMPGLDLVHYFLQDARLVRRLAPAAAIAGTLSELQHSAPADYLRRTGWLDHSLMPVIACLAWKQGAGHQENDEVLNTALEMARTVLPDR